jgi:hypothetical protein
MQAIVRGGPERLQLNLKVHSELIKIKVIECRAFAFHEISSNVDKAKSH